jgi:hypothetical protein
MFICRLKMDSLSTLVVRFYFGGQFYNNDQIIKYCDDRQAISYIYRDHVSLAEIVGHAQDHCVLKEGNLLHWLFPGRDIMNSLRTVTSDQACLNMSNSICESVWQKYMLKTELVKRHLIQRKLQILIVRRQNKVKELYQL